MSKLIAGAAAIVALSLSTMACAQQPPVAPTASPAAPQKYTLDTPIETLVGDPAAKAVVLKEMPHLLEHPSYEMFKTMSLRELQPMSSGLITDAILEKISTGLAQLKS